MTVPIGVPGATVAVAVTKICPSPAPVGVQEMEIELPELLLEQPPAFVGEMFWICTFVRSDGTRSVSTTGVSVGLLLPKVAESVKVTCWPGAALPVRKVFWAPRKPTAAAEKLRLWTAGEPASVGVSVGTSVDGAVVSLGCGMSVGGASVTGISVGGTSVTGISVGGGASVGSSVGSTHTGSVAIGAAPGSSAAGVPLPSNCA